MNLLESAVRLCARIGFASALMVCGLAFASVENPGNGAEYGTLQKQQTIPAGSKKVEVIEFFMYHCPACNALEPELLEWVKQQGDKIVFRRIHIPGPRESETHLFLTLEAMGNEATLHDSVLRAWHVDHLVLKDDADNVAWAVKNGLDKEKFLGFYNSFAVITKLRDVGRVTSNYEVESTPTFVVNGQYLTNPSMVHESNRAVPIAKLNQATLGVVSSLVAKVRSGKSS